MGNQRTRKRHQRKRKNIINGHPHHCINDLRVGDDVEEAVPWIRCVLFQGIIGIGKRKKDLMGKEEGNLL